MSDNPIEQLSIDLSMPTNFSHTISGFTSNEDLSVLGGMDLNTYAKLSAGEKIRRVFSDPDVNLPNPLKCFRLRVHQKMFEKSNLQKYILDYCSKDKKCTLVNWGYNDNIEGNFEAEFKNANPNALLGAIAAGIKENSAALGKDAALFDVKAIERIPGMSEHINQYSQRKI